MKCCVVIPMYGKEEYTKKCIEFTQKNAGVSHNILVVDDGSKTPFTEKFDPIHGVEIMRLRENTGFTNAVNQGILWAQYHNYDAVLLLNNDTEPERNFLKELVSVMDSDPTVGIVGSVRRHPKKKGEPIELCGSDLIRGYQYFTEEAKLPKEPIPCNWFPVCSGLLRMDMIREIGLLDKRMRNHCSDTQYCFKAKFANWQVMLVPKSIVVHHLSVTTSSNNILVDDDQRIMLEWLAGLDMAKLMSAMALDGEAGTYGRLTFEVYKK